jgi:hypothetical protein
VRDLSELKTRVGRPFECLSPDQMLISEFEHHFHVTLPADYVKLLRYFNGGEQELSAVYRPDADVDPAWWINRFYYLVREKAGLENLWEASAHWRSILGPMAVPFAENGLGDQFFLDISTTPASVKIYYHEVNAIVEIAPSFEQFIDRLERHREVDEQS